MPKKIIVGILDWGLGHATRCIPLISYLLQTKCQIFIATSGPQKKVLLEAFPGLVFIDPPPYAVRYPRKGKNLVFSLIKQLARLNKIIETEHDWLQKAVAEYGFDLIISDNRYGFHAPGIPSVIITHQLSPRSGMGSVLDNLVRKIHYRYLGKFDECWVPDLQPAGGLAGSLSHPDELPSRTLYIGPLSRLSNVQATIPSRLLVILSGPEPARSQFEEIIRSQLKDYQEPYLLVRGLPGNEIASSPNELNHADTKTMDKLMAEANLVICRSGYTSIMDLVKLGKKAVLVPTPGQPEQEYLAHHLHQRSLFPFMSQEKFNLLKAIEQSKDYHYQMLEADFETYKHALQHLIK
jgi:UDP:flavonoid glycosyltransferase YjiC (YdhE family)